jgi:hypothetical protein
MTVQHRAPARRVPELDAFLLEGLFRRRKHLAASGTASIWVDAEPFHDDTDARVFGAAFARQEIDGEPWLVRGVLRSVESGRPVMCRVVIEHFSDQAREVTGTVARDINLGTIRSEALIRLREKAGSRVLLAQSGHLPQETAEMARAAAVEAARGALARGPHGGYRPEHYRSIALRRLELDAEGQTGVVGKLCAEWSALLSERVDRERMRDWLRKATQMGFLSPGRPGVTTRKPGPNLYPKENDNA